MKSSILIPLISKISPNPGSDEQSPRLLALQNAIPIEPPLERAECFERVRAEIFAKCLGRQRRVLGHIKTSAGVQHQTVEFLRQRPKARAVAFCYFEIQR